MDIPRNAMPGPEGTAAPGGEKPQEPKAPANGGGQAPAVPPAPAGSRTPESNLHAALSEERKLRQEAEIRAEEEAARRREAERKLKELEPLPDEPSDEGEVPEDGDSKLKNEVRDLKSRLSATERREQRRELEAKYPQLADNRAEFDQFLEDEENSRIPVSKAAKLFLAEKGLLETPVPPRKGLERPTGGPRSPGPAKMSQEDVKRLRETQPRKYIKMLRDGALKPDEIES